MKRFRVLLMFVLVAGLFGIPSAPASADADAGCAALGGVITGADVCEVQVSQADKGSAAAYTLTHTLVVKAGVTIDATGPSTDGITINIAGADDAHDDLIMEAGSKIEANDPATPSGNSARPITLNVADDMVMMAGSTLAENTVASGNGGAVDVNVGDDFTMQSGSVISSSKTAGTEGGTAGDITVDVGGNMLMEPNTVIKAEGQNNFGGDVLITVDGDMTMQGTAGPLAGAVISSQGLTASDDAGNITIKVGNFPNTPPSGVFTQETGAVITANSPGSAGEIDIEAGHSMEVDGSVLSEGGQSGVPNQPRGGGPISLDSGCGLVISDTGLVSSKGQDPGADLVHLASCEVFVFGVVRSFAPGAGHVLPVNPPNRCNNDNANHPLNGATGHAACVEIYGNNVVIDSTVPHNGEVYTSGIRGPMKSWIDIIAQTNVTVVGETTGPYAVHADACNATNAPNAPCSNSFGGIITVKAKDGKVSSTNKAFSATATAGGGDGGQIIVEAGGAGSPAGDVDIDASSIDAHAATGDNTKGGLIALRSFNGIVVGTAGAVLNASGDGATFPGVITLTGCGTVAPGDGVSFAGTANPAAPNPVQPDQCGGSPSLPANAATSLHTEIWEACEEPQDGSKSGRKFNDLNNNGMDDAEPGIANVEIHIFASGNGSAYHDHTLTNGNGDYSFTIPAAELPGTFTVCETVPATYTQTFPTTTTTPAETDGTSCDSHGAGVGTGGWTFTLEPGQTEEGNDFGNFQRPLECPEDPGHASQITRTVAPSPKGPVPNHTTVQAAYDAAQASAISPEVIGMFSNTVENVVLNGPKPVTFRQCTLAKVTAANNDLPVWDIGPAAGHLLIVGPDAVGGTVGWNIQAGANGHELKGLRAESASVCGIFVGGNSNSIGINAVKNSNIGICVEGDSNDFRPTGTVETSTSDGVQLRASANSNLFRVSNILSNGGNGIVVEGDGNTVRDVGRIDLNALNGLLVTSNNNQVLKNRAASDNNKGNGQDGIKVIGSNNNLEENKANDNGGDGIDVSGGAASATANKLKKNESNQTSAGGTKENTGAEYRLLNWVKNNGGGNKADNVVVPKTSAPTKCNGAGVQFPATNVTSNFTTEQVCE